MADQPRMSIVGWPTTMEELRPGLFAWRDEGGEFHFGFKSEYRNAQTGQCDAFNDAGEFFCLTDKELGPVEITWEEQDG